MRISKVLLSFEALVWSAWLTVGKVIPLVVKLSQKKQKKQLALTIKQRVWICALLAHFAMS